jgi:D-proline reductase (dithiol) PrdB
MARLSEIAEPTGSAVANLPCPEFDTKPWVSGPALKDRKIAMISTAGFMRRGEEPFRGGDAHFHPIPQDIAANDLLMSHVSVNFDRTGFRQDINVMLPRDRMAELVASGEIGAVADTHYSFMGATDPVQMQSGALEVAAQLQADGVDSAVLIPV